jgi:outer membrane lipoprotein carrier protein
MLCHVNVVASEVSVEDLPEATPVNLTKVDVKKSTEIPVVSILVPKVITKEHTTLPLNTAINTVIATQNTKDKKLLMTKLAQLDFFSANFTQKILSESGDLLQEGSGTLSISKPNLVNWQTIEPDETSIVSDGKTLWFYDPFIEQASAYSLDKAIDNTPMLLLTNNDESLWIKYTVEQRDDEFIITPLTQESQIKSLSLRFSTTDSVQLSEFAFKDVTGQVSRIELSKFNATDKPAAKLFEFILPEGVRLEDER